MKKLLYILLFVPFALFGQGNDPCYSINNVYQEIEDANQPITLDLLSGWNMIGYSCVNEETVDEALSPIINKIIVVKNNAGSVYLPEYNFNGIGVFLPNQGYQIKVSEAEIGFELCSYHINYHQIEGCTDCEAVNFNQWANVDDGSCQYNICNDPQADNYQEVLPCIYYGCNDPLAANYDPYANTDDGSCVVAEACPYDNYLEYSPDAISYNANLCQTLIVYGCTDNTALNYNSDANVDNESCEFIYGCIDQEADNYNIEATTNDGSCIYYGCMDPTAGNYDELANTDDGTCLIGGCINPTAENYNPDAGVDDGSCVIYGCVLSDFPNYNSVANTDDGSCDMNSSDVFGCTDESTITYEIEATIDNGLCYFGPTPEIGDFILGGIVFYINETGQGGLIAAMEDLEGYYEWGCDGTSVSGADGQAIGTGYQNTMDIVNQGCPTEEGGITAAQAALEAEINSYSDWYLPSIEELIEMYNTIGEGGIEDNIGGFETGNWPYHWSSNYWSSSENYSNDAYYSNCAWGVDFGNGFTLTDFWKGNDIKVRVIRSF